MDKNKPQLDLTKLTPDQRAQLDAYNQAKEQLEALKDIADMTQETLNVLEKNDPNKSLQDMGALLVDMRGALRDLNDKEAPEQEDIAQPIVDALSKLEKALASSVSAQKAPVVNLPKADTPVVKVDAPDLSKVEKILKTDIPKAFQQAIQGIVIPKNDDSATTQLLEAITEQLASIDTGVRLKPQAPTTVAVTNPDGSSIGSLSGSTIYITVLRTDAGDPETTYIGKAVPGTATSDAAWQVASLDENTNLDLLYADGGAFTQVYDDRESLTYA